MRDPTGYLPNSRMPRVRLGDAARMRIVAWLSGLGRADSLSAVPPVGDAYRGGRLFESLQCQGCHAAGGTGGRVGPALDHLGWKVDGVRVLLAQARGEISDSPYILFARQIRVPHQK